MGSGIYKWQMRRTPPAGRTRKLAVIMAAWIFLLSGTIHLLHTGSSFQIIDCSHSQCEPHRQSGSSGCDTGHQSDHLLIYPSHPINNQDCPACDFLSNSKIEYLYYGPDIEPPLESSWNAGPVVEISISTCPPLPVLPRAPPSC